MDDHCDVNIVERRKLAERSNYSVLLVKSVQGLILTSHHELQIVDNDVRYVVNVNCMRHSLVEKRNNFVQHQFKVFD